MRKGEISQERVCIYRERVRQSTKRVIIFLLLQREKIWKAIEKKIGRGYKEIL